MSFLWLHSKKKSVCFMTRFAREATIYIVCVPVLLLIIMYARELNVLQYVDGAKRMTDINKYGNIAFNKTKSKENSFYINLWLKTAKPELMFSSCYGSIPIKRISDVSKFIYKFKISSNVQCKFCEVKMGIKSIDDVKYDKRHTWTQQMSVGTYIFDHRVNSKWDTSILADNCDPLFENGEEVTLEIDVQSNNMILRRDPKYPVKTMNNIPFDEQSFKLFVLFLRPGDKIQLKTFAIKTLGE